MPDPTPGYHVPKTRTYIPKKVSPEEMTISLLSGDFILPSELANQALIPSRDLSGLHALPNPLKRLETLETKHALARDILHRPIAHPMDVPAVLERAAAVKASLDMPNRRARAQAAREEFMADINAFTKTHASSAAESMIKVAKSKITTHKAEAAAVRNAGWVLSMCTMSETHPDGLSNGVVGAVFGANELKGPLNGLGAVRSVDHFRGMTPSERAEHRAAALEVFGKRESAFAPVKGLDSRTEAQADGASEILNGTNKAPQVQPNGQTNGLTKAYANGLTKAYANGRTNGHAKGHFKPVPNGHSNGERKANRHPNGHSHTNGDGSDHSHPNGFSNGAVNGDVINGGDVAHTGCCIVILRSLQDQLIDARVSARHATDVSSLNLAQIDRMTLTIADLNARLSAAEENVAVARRNNKQLKRENSLLDDANGRLEDLSRRASRQSTPSFGDSVDSNSDSRSQSSQAEELAESQSALERAIADQLTTAQQLSRAEEELGLSRIALSAAKTAHGDTAARLRLAQTQLAAQGTQSDEIVDELELVKDQKASLTSALDDTEAELEDAKARLVSLRSTSESDRPSPAELTELLELREQMKQLDYLRQRLKEQDLKEEQITNAPCTRCKRTHVPHCACCPARPARGVGLAPPKAKVSKSRSPAGTLCYRTPRTSPTGTLVIHTPSGTLRLPMASSSPRVSPRSASRRSPSTHVTVRGVLQRLSPRSSPGQPKFSLRPLLAGKGNLKLVNGKFHLRSPQPPKAVEVTVIEESAPLAETEALETTTSAEDWEDAADDPTSTTPVPPAPNNTPFKPKPQGRHRLGARPMQPLDADVFSSIKSPAPIMGSQDSAPSTVSSETSSAVPTFVVPRRVRPGIPRFSQVNSEAQVQTGGDAEVEDMEPLLPVLRLTEPSLDGIAASVTLDTSAVVRDLGAVKEEATEKQEPSAPHIHPPTPQQPQTPPRTAGDIVDSVDRSNWAVTMRGNLRGSTPIRSPIGAAHSPLDDSPSFLATLSAESAISVESPQQLAPAADETHDSDSSFPYSNSGRSPWDTPCPPSRYDDSHITGFTASPTPTPNQTQSQDNEGDGRSVGNAADIPPTSPNSLAASTSFASSASSASVADRTIGLSAPAGDESTSAVAATPGTPAAAEAECPPTPEGPVSHAAGSPRSHWGSVPAKKEKETKPVDCSTTYEDAVACAARFNAKAKERAKPSLTSSPHPPPVEKYEAWLQLSARCKAEAEAEKAQRSASPLFDSPTLSGPTEEGHESSVTHTMSEVSDDAPAASVFAATSLRAATPSRPPPRHIDLTASVPPTRAETFVNLVQAVSSVSLPTGGFAFPINRPTTPSPPSSRTPVSEQSHAPTHQVEESSPEATPEPENNSDIDADGETDSEVELEQAPQPEVEAEVEAVAEALRPPLSPVPGRVVSPNRHAFRTSWMGPTFPGWPAPPIFEATPAVTRTQEPLVVPTTPTESTPPAGITEAALPSFPSASEAMDITPERREVEDSLTRGLIDTPRTAASPSPSRAPAAQTQLYMPASPTPGSSVGALPLAPVGTTFTFALPTLSQHYRAITATALATGDMEMSAHEASDETESSFDLLVDERSKEDVVAPLAPAVEHVARPVDADTHIASVLDNMIGAQDAELLSVTDALGDVSISSTSLLAPSTITELSNSSTLTSLTPNNAIEIRTATEHADTALAHLHGLDAILPDHSFGVPELNQFSDRPSDPELQASTATATNAEGAAPSDPEFDAALSFFQSQQAAASAAGQFDPELAENEHLVGLSKAGDEGKAQKEATETDAAHAAPTDAEALALFDADCANATGLDSFDTSVFLPLPQVQAEMPTPPPEAGEGTESEEYTVETYTLLDQVKAEAVQIPSFLPTPLPVPSTPSAGPSWSAPVPDAHVDNSDNFSEISELSQIDGIPVVYRHQVPDSPVDDSDNFSEISELSQIDGIPVVYRHQIDSGMTDASDGIGESEHETMDVDKDFYDDDGPGSGDGVSTAAQRWMAAARIRAPPFLGHGDTSSVDVPQSAPQVIPTRREQSTPEIPALQPPTAFTWTPNNAEISASYNPAARFMLDISEMSDGPEDSEMEDLSGQVVNVPAATSFMAINASPSSARASSLSFGETDQSIVAPEPQVAPTWPFQADSPFQPPPPYEAYAREPNAPVSITPSSPPQSQAFEIVPPQLNSTAKHEVEFNSELAGQELFNFTHPERSLVYQQSLLAHAPSEDLREQFPRGVTRAEEGRFDALLAAATDATSTHAIIVNLLTLRRPESELGDALRHLLADRPTREVIEPLLNAAIDGDRRAAQLLYAAATDASATERQEGDMTLDMLVLALLVLDGRRTYSRDQGNIDRLIQSPAVLRLVALAVGEQHPSLPSILEANATAHAWLEHRADMLIAYLQRSASPSAKGGEPASPKPSVEHAVAALVALTRIEYPVGRTSEFRTAWPKLQDLAINGVTEALDALIHAAPEQNSRGKQARLRLIHVANRGNARALQLLVALTDAGLSPLALITGPPSCLPLPMTGELIELAQAGSDAAWAALVPHAQNGREVEADAILTAAPTNAAAQVATAELAFNNTVEEGEIEESSLTRRARGSGGRAAAAVLGRLAPFNPAAWDALHAIAEAGGVHAAGYMRAMGLEHGLDLTFPNAEASTASLPVVAEQPAVPRKKPQAARYLGTRQPALPIPGAQPPISLTPPTASSPPRPAARSSRTEGMIGKYMDYYTRQGKTLTASELEDTLVDQPHVVAGYAAAQVHRDPWALDVWRWQDMERAARERARAMDAGEIVVEAVRRKRSAERDDEENGDGGGESSGEEDGGRGEEEQTRRTRARASAPSPEPLPRTQRPATRGRRQRGRRASQSSSGTESRENLTFALAEVPEAPLPQQD